MPKGKGHDVICPGCRESYHETTESYDPNRDANAGMLELKAIYKSYGWDEPVRDPTAGYGILICPDCEAPLAPSGRLEVREKEPEITPLECPPVAQSVLDGLELEKELQESVVVNSKGEVKPDTVSICPKCQTPVIAAEGDKMAICPTHGEIPLEELVSTEASSDKSSGSFSMESVIKAAKEAEKKKESPQKQLPIEDLDKNYPDMTGNGKWICPHCQREFKKKAHLGSHMRAHKK